MQKLIIDAEKRSSGINIKELVQYRDLFLVLAYRDFKVRYAQTFLGFLWAFIQPAATLIIFTLVFGKAVNVDTGLVPYPVFALAGMAAWMYFAFVMGQAGDSIIGAQQMVKKIFFPRLIIPLSKAVVGLVDFIIGFFLLLMLMLVYKVFPSASLLYLPVFIALLIMAALGVGIWLSALTIRYRDFKHIVPFMIQFGLYASPVGYPTHLIPEKYQVLYYLNPMAGIIDGFRFAILGQDFSMLSLLSFAVAILLFITSLFYFKKVEKVMADLV